MAWLQELGDQIRKARRQADLSQQELAKSLSVSRGQLSNYENGKCPANVNVITEIAEGAWNRVHCARLSNRSEQRSTNTSGPTRRAIVPSLRCGTSFPRCGVNN